MSAVTITVDDLRPFVPDIEDSVASAMIEHALAIASAPGVAPCIIRDDFAYPAQGKAIIVMALLRWSDAGSGAVTQVSVGPFQQTIDNRTDRKRLFWPSEITDLQRLCGVTRTGRAFTIDTTPRLPEADS